MQEIAAKIKNKAGFAALRGADEETVRSAEQTLGVKFADDYRQYVLAYGAASFEGHELTGVCPVPRLNVVDVTKEERSFADSIPQNWYVIEQTHMDGIAIWQTQSGEIYSSSPEHKPLKIFNSLCDYIEN